MRNRSWFEKTEQQSKPLQKAGGDSVSEFQVLSVPLFFRISLLRVTCFLVFLVGG
jgi:hypothetical protein